MLRVAEAAAVPVSKPAKFGPDGDPGTQGGAGKGDLTRFSSSTHKFTIER